MSSLLSPELEAVELEIDNSYSSNPLVRLDFATAAWSLLAFAEDMMLKPYVTDERRTSHEFKAQIDNLLVNLKYPMFWLFSSCPAYGTISFYSDENYQAAWEMMNLAEEYDTFWTVITYAHRGWIELSLDDNEIITTRPEFLTETEYEAYSRLIEPRVEHPEIDSSNLLEKISRSLKIEGGRFFYKLNPKIVSIATDEVIKPIFDTMFSLPSDWQFLNYSLADFRRVFTAITAVAYIHFLARILAAENGSIGLGIDSSIYVPSREELKARIARYSRVDKDALNAIFDDLTYGEQNMRYPDPVLQPLIPLNQESYAIMPHLWIGNAAERNFTVLLNRLPDEKRIYSELVEGKEKLMRERITQALVPYGFRFVYGNVPQHPDLADIDLAILDDSQKICLLTELKWFIDPAEVREILEKTQELEKGVSQLLHLREAMTENLESFVDKLGIDATYKIQPVLISANWIGFSNVQCPDIPIINEDHIVKKIGEVKNLAVVADWLSTRKYLPVEGKHYRIIEKMYRIGKWRVKWYNIKPLISDSLLLTE